MTKGVAKAAAAGQDGGLSVLPSPYSARTYCSTSSSADGGGGNIAGAQPPPSPPLLPLRAPSHVGGAAGCWLLANRGVGAQAEVLVGLSWPPPPQNSCPAPPHCSHPILGEHDELSALR
eukprot:CAMPEP_0202343078 /NCGR_PEP_ID=MMETSP1126-20121109/3358_1 /ASSEMBLY_ACC=CAM_ASM_000457 /TAXON_ID=3047 /ORGANISM="Dunaliella tertiolecta, Strain CCMP1320" /LENGTH=118 /DNA_ID=CAMNT_0048934105 /DNA_START=1025 /DNA_END=1378 /DNA_ORIENTATION=+